MKLCRLLLVLSALLFTHSYIGSAQTPEPRLHGSIRSDTRAVLAGSRSPRSVRAQDLGPIRADVKLEGITLVFRRSPMQETALQQLLLEQQDPASTAFHQWLTPQAFGERFGMAEEDVTATKSWLAAQGFQGAALSHARDRITFSGTAAQVQRAFGTALHRYQIENEVHMAPAGDLSLPADLAGITTAVLHLSDFRPKPMARPAFTAALDQQHYLIPADLRVMYDMPHDTASNYVSGLGQSIAIVGQSYVDTSGSSRFSNFANVTGAQMLFGVLVPNTGVEAISPYDAAETEIDLEYAGGVVPSANLFLVHVGSDPNYNVFDALAFAIDEDIAPVISISYGECETFLSATDVQQSNALFEQAATQGQTLIAAAGDAGSTACARFPVSSYLSADQQQALAVDFPAASPYVTAVGGTQMAAGTFAPGSSDYWSAATLGFDQQISLLSYVPEVAWNEDSTFGLFAGGGGASAVYPRPSWQSGIPGIPQGSTRLLPDISLQASSDNPGFILCTDDASFLASEGQEFGCQSSLRGDNSRYTVGGGTSFAAPVVAAMTALLNQNLHDLGQGPLNANLYRLAQSTASSASVFHDVVSGSIACTPGTPRCGAAGQTGFAATPGYDQATGLGSVDFAHLLAAWPARGAISRGGTVTEVSPSDYKTAAGAFDPFNIRVSAYPSENATLPTGTVSVSVDGIVADPAVPVSSLDPSAVTATGSYLFYAPSTTGSHIATITYSGDAKHAPSTATVSILVGNVMATGGVSLSATNVTVPNNGYASSNITVTPTGGYNGRLFWSLAVVGGTSNSRTGCYSIPTLAVQGTSILSLQLGSGSACHSPLPAARSAMRPMTPSRAADRASSEGWPSTVAVAACLLGCLLPVARRRPAALLCLLLTVGGLGLSGCGSSSSKASASAGTGNGGTSSPAAVTYTATLTGQDSVNGSITSSTSFSLTLQ